MATRKSTTPTRPRRRRHALIPKPTPARVDKHSPSGHQDPTLAPELYAVVVVGNCMAPALSDGTTILVHKTMQCRRGDLVVVYPTKAAQRAGPLAGIVKRLVLSPPPAFVPGSEVVGCLVLAQDNPPRQHVIAIDRVQAVHKVIGPVDPEYVIGGVGGKLCIPENKLQQMLAVAALEPA